MGTTTTITAADFVNEMGVDTHIPYTDGGYANVGKVIADLQYLGLSNVRDGITDGQSGSASLSSYIALARAGIKFTVVGNDVDHPTPETIASTLELIDRLNTAVPGSVVAVEGANEVNNWPVTYEGQTGLAGAVALQRALYSAVHSDPALEGVPVDYFTGYNAGSVAVGPDPSKTAGLADFDTQHPYPNWSEAPAAWLATGQALGNEPTPGPFVYTETGYTTNATQTGGVNQDVQAKYLLDLYFDAAADGASRTYVYQLMDAYAPGSPQGDEGFGLFNPDGTAKPSATAIHNLTTILADSGSTAASFTPGTLNYTVSGLPSSGNSMAIAQSNGTFDIAVWNEPQIWNATTTSETIAAPVPITVQLGGTYASVSVYDPMVGPAPIETVSNVSALQLSVTDHPLIIKLGSPANAMGETGGTGATGEATRPGDTETTGTTGATGGVGATGDTGATGTTGIVGPTGATGATGDTGLTGATGATGAIGAQGSVGATGDTGAQGATGDQGSIGTTGATGDQGSVGTTGATGDQGSVGATGATGATGAQGNIGPTGPVGLTGPVDIAPPTGIASATSMTNPDGTTTETFSGGPYFDGRKYSSYSEVFGADGTLLYGIRNKNNGVQSVKVEDGGTTQTSDSQTNYNNNGAPSTTFVFNPGHGADVVSLMLVNGLDHDTLSLLGTDFHHSIAAVLHNTTDTPQGSVTFDPVTGDTVRLTGVSKSELVHHKQDFTFHA